MDSQENEPEIPARSARRTRIVNGAGGGSVAGSLVAVIVAFAYREKTGNHMPAEVAAAFGGLFGALAATVAICIDDIRAIMHAKFGTK